jgi:hypothetical protein
MKTIVSCLLLVVASLCLAGCIGIGVAGAPPSADHSFLENQAQRGSFD